MNSKAMAKKTLKQITQEPLEILKTAREQVSPGEPPSSLPQEATQLKVDQNKNEAQDKVKSGRRMEALDRELKDIERERILKDLQRKISEGQEVYLEDYHELSMDQKQVLKGQIEAVHVRSLQFKSQGRLVEPGAKKGRKLFNFGQKQAAQRQTTRVEKPVPPSG